MTWSTINEIDSSFYGRFLACQAGGMSYDVTFYNTSKKSCCSVYLHFCQKKSCHSVYFYFCQKNHVIVSIPISVNLHSTFRPSVSTSFDLLEKGDSTLLGSVRSHTIVISVTLISTLWNEALRRQLSVRHVSPSIVSPGFLFPFDTPLVIETI